MRAGTTRAHGIDLSMTIHWDKEVPNTSLHSIFARELADSLSEILRLGNFRCGSRTAVSVPMTAQSRSGNRLPSTNTGTG
jgi:hypothetical protein